MRVKLEDVDSLEREINKLLSNVRVRVYPVKTIGRIYVAIEMVKNNGNDDVLYRAISIKEAYKFLLSVHRILCEEKCNS